VAIFGVNSLGNGTYFHAEAFSIGVPFLHIEVAHANIIGVVVVIIFVAGFFGLHA
jgi:hypothetical protein